MLQTCVKVFGWRTDIAKNCLPRADMRVTLAEVLERQLVRARYRLLAGTGGDYPYLHQPYRLRVNVTRCILFMRTILGFPFMARSAPPSSPPRRTGTRRCGRGHR